VLTRDASHNSLSLSKFNRILIYRKLATTKQEYEVYLENELHGFGDEAEPASALLYGSIGGGSRRVRSNRRVRRNRSIGERVEKAFGSSHDSGEVNVAAYGVDWGNFVEADEDFGGDEPGAVGEVVARE